ncbi:hypothetical protein H6G81_27455 [Scytonema hofmannii FACHB-248]|uniref:Uncharacterized protein n=1 Tax=Scytonema hofmannii FACHB-248 TaxID=1842502 RepID=A0ABR8GYQ5_9CYAN|nr:MULTISPECIES: hypothetical protein [Nostocales]MBD2608150.1 hypothetical protein [Scytonema hofmannii FACHB-248]
MSNSQSVVVSATSYLRDNSEDLGKGFWLQWQQYRDELYGCCIKWMGLIRINLLRQPWQQLSRQ